MSYPKTILNPPPPHPTPPIQTKLFSKSHQQWRMQRCSKGEATVVLFIREKGDRGEGGGRALSCSERGLYISQQKSPQLRAPSPRSATDWVQQLTMTISPAVSPHGTVALVGSREVSAAWMMVTPVSSPSTLVHVCVMGNKLNKNKISSAKENSVFI